MSYDTDKTTRANEDAKFFKAMLRKTCGGGWNCDGCHSIQSGCLIWNIRKETKLDDDEITTDFTNEQELLDFISWVVDVCKLTPWHYCSDVDCEKCEWIKGVEIKESMVSSCPRTKLYYMFREKV